MLISFSVSNFRSIGVEQTLNLVASNKITDHPDHVVRIPRTSRGVVRTAVIYGANAAGKSNLVRAMAAAQSLVNADERGEIEPFRFNDHLAHSPSSFEFRMMVRDRIYIYGFDVKGDEIQSEWLSLMEDEREELVFERDRSGKTITGQSIAVLYAEDKALEEVFYIMQVVPLRPQQLVLNRVKSFPDRSQSTILGEIIRWLTRDLLILLPNHRSIDILDRLSQDEGFRALTESFLGSVGTGVSSLQFVEEELGPEHVSKMLSGRVVHRNRRRQQFEDVRQREDGSNRFIARTLFANHVVGDEIAALPFIEESDGTKQLLHFMHVLSSPKRGAKVVVIDELDRSLHPLICWEFIRIFSSTAPGAYKQLIVTTHEAHLLDQDLLRRDEYWFVEKDKLQQSQLVSLSDFKIRKDLQIERGYLHGRFGGIPLIGSMAAVERLLGESDE